MYPSSIALFHESKRHEKKGGAKSAPFEIEEAGKKIIGGKTGTKIQSESLKIANGRKDLSFCVQPNAAQSVDGVYILALRASAIGRRLPKARTCLRFQL